MLDLSLARTYIPVCICVAKIIILCSMTAFTGAIGVPQYNANVILGVILLLDRIICKEYIFDTNAVTLFVFAALIVNRERYEQEERPVFGIILNVLWAIVAMAAPFKPEQRIPVFQYLPYNTLIISGAMVVVHSFVGLGSEMVIWTFLRVFNFVIFSIAWLYVVNVENSFTHSVNSCVDCFVYFGHILFTALPVAVCSIILTTVILILYPKTENKGEEIKMGLSDAAESTGERTPPAEPDEEDLEAVFRQAKARMQTSFAVVQQRGL